MNATDSPAREGGAIESLQEKAAASEVLPNATSTVEAEENAGHQKKKEVDDGGPQRNASPLQEEVTQKNVSQSSPEKGEGTLPHDDEGAVQPPPPDAPSSTAEEEQRGRGDGQQNVESQLTGAVEDRGAQEKGEGNGVATTDEEGRKLELKTREEQLKREKEEPVIERYNFASAEVGAKVQNEKEPLKEGEAIEKEREGKKRKANKVEKRSGSDILHITEKGRQAIDR